MSTSLSTLKVLLHSEELEKAKDNCPNEETPLWYYWEEFVQYKFDKGRSLITVQSVKDSLKLVIRKLELYSLEACNDSNRLDAALMSLKKERGFSESTFNSYLKRINCYFIWLERKGYIKQNNVRKIDRCSEPLKEQLVLSDDQVKAITAHMHIRRQTRLERLRNVLFIDLLVLTGARPSELISIKISDIRPIDNTYKLVIRGKKQKGRLRYYRLPSWVRDSYANYIAYRNELRPDEELLLVSSSKRTGWTRQGVRGLFKKLSKELGFSITAMGFRRFVATRLNKENLDIKHIQNHLGHTRVSTTQRYIERSCHLTNEGVNVLANFHNS